MVKRKYVAVSRRKLCRSGARKIISTGFWRKWKNVSRVFLKNKKNTELSQQKKIRYTFSPIFPNEDIMNRAYEIIRESK